VEEGMELQKEHTTHKLNKFLKVNANWERKESVCRHPTSGIPVRRPSYFVQVMFIFLITTIFIIIIIIVISSNNSKK
jgi:hypothetical protein